MKIEEIRAMKSKEIHEELERMRRHLFDLRAQSVTEKLEDPNQITHAKRSIARILTVLRERGETNIEQTQTHLTAEATRNR